MWTYTHTHKQYSRSYVQKVQLPAYLALPMLFAFSLLKFVCVCESCCCDVCIIVIVAKANKTLNFHHICNHTRCFSLYDTTSYFYRMSMLMHYRKTTLNCSALFHVIRLMWDLLCVLCINLWDVNCRKKKCRAKESCREGRISKRNGFHGKLVCMYGRMTQTPNSNWNESEWQFTRPRFAWHNYTFLYFVVVCCMAAGTQWTTPSISIATWNKTTPKYLQCIQFCGAAWEMGLKWLPKEMRQVCGE